MRKYLHYLKNLKTCLLFIGILCCCSNQSFSQNIRLKIERLGVRIFSPLTYEKCEQWGSTHYDDCGLTGPGTCDPWYPDPVINSKLIINTIEYQLPEFRGYDYVASYINIVGFPDLICLTGWTQAGWNFSDIGSCDAPGNEQIDYPLSSPTSFYALWYTNNNFNTSNNIDILFNAFEDDNAICGGDDAGCFGWNPLAVISDIPNTIDPCGEEIKDSMTCTSDGATRIWGLHYKVSWQWRALQADEIDLSKNICVGTNSVTVRPTAYGSLPHTNFQWQVSTDASNWTDISGAQGFVNVNTSGYTSSQFIYVRKVKKGIACSGFPTPADEFSNICIINIRAAPTVAPTATLVPNFNGVCEATIINPVDQYNGVVALTWEYQTSYDGVNWSTIQNTIPTLVNPTTTTVTGRIRFRAVYSCGNSPWRTYAWTMYPQIVAPVATQVYPLDIPFVTNYTCSTDSMYVVFTPGYGGLPGADDEFEYTTDGGTTWLPYTNGQRIRTTYGATLSYGIRARRTTPTFANSGCNTTTAYKYYGYWTPYRPATSPSLVSKTPNTASICITATANVSATILGGSFGIGGQATDLYQYSIDSGINWNSYTSGANISTTSATGAIMIRARRLDGSSTNECSTNWSILAKWLIIDPTTDFTYTSALCYNPSAPIIELSASNPNPGVGAWSITQGTGTLSSTSTLNTQLTDISMSAPLTRVRWTVTEAGCVKTRTVTITPTTVSNINLTNGNTCQTCPVRNGNTIRFYDNTGRLMANIADAVSPNAELAATEVCVGIDASVQTVTTNAGNQQAYLQRHFSIDPVNNTNTYVTLYFTATEFNNLRTACNTTPFAFTNVNELIVSKFPNGSNNNYSLPNAIGGSYIIPTASGLDANGYYFITIPVSSFSTFYIHSYGNEPAVLPIELVYFDAVCEKGKIRIEWQTASENNNHHFEIERSENAIDFETIVTIPTQNGNANYQQNYTAFDNSPNTSINYYRLKQVDNNGQYSYSNLTLVDCHESTSSTMIRLYPNPAEDKLFIRLENIITEVLFVKIMNTYSSVVYETKWENPLINSLNEIDIEHLPAGVYFIQIYDSKNRLFHQKVIKK